MRRIISMATATVLLGALPAGAESMAISPNGSRPTATGPAANFTGNVLVEPYYAANAQTPQTGGHVVFAPGARSAWHTHPAGQLLIVTSGTGWIQEEGGRKREIKPGDVIWTPPGLKHWHGAAATTSMGHTAITNVLGGKGVEWMEQVTDEQYRAP
jgi:quercetin dioxygenase-like cupin family protein